jgi:hypothetical protein
MKRLLYVVPMLVLGLAGCSSTKGTAAPPSTTVPITPGAAATSPAATPSSASPTPAKTKPAVPNVKAQALALSDLPAGWSQHKIDNSSKGEPACFKVLDADTTKPLAKAEVEYQGTPNGLPLLDEDISYGPKAAASEFTKAVKALDRCGKISVTTNGTTLSGAMGAMSFPKMGNQSKAYQLTLSGVVKGVPVSAGFDILLLRAGGEDVSLLYSTFGAPDIRDFQGAAKLAMDKINQAGTTA